MALDFGLINSGLFDSSSAFGDGIDAPIASQIVWNDVGMGIVPVGAIIAWHKNIPGAPPLLPNFLECNGQVVDNSESPMDGQTLDDLNGDARFLRGAATSGTEQQSNIGGNAAKYEGGEVDFLRLTSTSWQSTYPVNLSVVWVIRIY